MALELIELATLGPGATRITAGVCETWKGTIFTQSGPVVAYVKVLPLQQLISEVICSCIGRALGLQILKPFLVRIDRENLPQSHAWQTAESSCMGFGSCDGEHPSFLRWCQDNNASLEAILQKWDGYKVTALFDEWIANDDRHMGNLLYDGKGGFWLIDHSHAFTGPRWKPPDLIPDLVKKNVLFDYALSKNLSLEAKYLWRDSATSESVRYTDLPLGSLNQSTYLEAYADKTEIDAALAFLESRATRFVRLICAKLGVGELPL